MRAQQALEQIRNTIFKPGWKFEAHEYGSDMVYVALVIKTVDTSYPSPDGRYRVPITIAPDTVFSVAGMDETDLAYKLLTLAIEADKHESREFLRVRQPDGSFKAPFHPHTREGERAWGSR